jgi:hypothetical protein
METSPLKAESIQDRLYATPRTDIIPGKALAPKTRSAVLEAERLIQGEHLDRITESAVRCGVDRSAGGAIMSQAAKDANFSLRYGELAFRWATKTQHGMAVTVLVSLRSALKKDDAKGREALTLDLVLDLLDDVPDEALNDFVDWYWRTGVHAIPKSPAETETK